MGAGAPAIGRVVSQTVAETSYYALLGPQHRQWLARLDADHDNMRAALAWALDSGEAELAQRLVFALSTFWYVRGHQSEGLMWAERALASSTETSTKARAGAMAVTAFMTWARGDAERAAELWAEAIPLKRQLESPTDLARALHTAGLAAEDRGDHEEARHAAGRGPGAVPAVGRDVLRRPRAQRAGADRVPPARRTSIVQMRTLPRRCTSSGSWATRSARVWHSPTAAGSRATGVITSRRPHCMPRP